MRAFSAVVVVAASFVAPCALAEEWVAKMFSEREHNFGVVAKGADTVFKFPIKNIYKQDIEIVSVRSSCGCTTPSIENKLLKTGDTGYIVASFNTRTFTGPHGATLTVDVKWNHNGILRRGETQLRVHGNIRGDLVFQPGAIKFDGIDQGAKAEQRIDVAHTGRSDWKITDVRGASDDLEVELVEKQRSGGSVKYELLVRVKDSAPAGYLNEQLVLITNDDQSPRIPIHVAGKVVPQIFASPEPLLLGKVNKGEQVTKRVIVRGKKPFKIVSVECPQDAFQFNTDDKVSDRHLVEIMFDAKGDSGVVKETIHINTDLGESYNATVTAYATVVDAPPAAAASDPGAAVGESGDGTAATATTVSKQVAGQ